MSINQTSNPSLIERLFNAGSHFGFSKTRRHPSVSKYIFTNKEGTDIFDLEKTSVLLENAKASLMEAGKEGKNILFVSTKDEASKYVTDAATKVSMPYVTNRWIGGMLTNYSEIKKRIDRLKKLTTERESGELDRKYTKKERVIIGREITKLQFNFGGITTMDKMPSFVLVVDPRHDSIAVQEANDMGIPVIAIMSSDCDTKKVTYPVVVNDAQKASINLALEELTNAYLEGNKSYVAPVINRNRSDRSDRPIRRNESSVQR
ncbi:30S ribosomal protein S2 [Candidatus Kaiserbacteria bacterium]|nr:30S ribosomal protein S2 [Candidatus Kaiserbacteria bacterium]